MLRNKENKETNKTKGLRSEKLRETNYKYYPRALFYEPFGYGAPGNKQNKVSTLSFHILEIYTGSI